MQLRPRRLVKRSGQALVEYALILALASLGIISVLIVLQRSVGGTLLGTGRRLDAAVGAPAGEARPGEPLGAETGAAGPAPGEGGEGKYEPGGPHGRR